MATERAANSSAFLRLKIKHFVAIAILILIVITSGLFTHLFEHDFHTEFEYPYIGHIQTSMVQLQNNEVPELAPINSYDYKYITNCQQKCAHNGEPFEMRLVYVVKSSLEHFDRRIAIRKTWGYEHRFSDVELRTVFVLGVSNDKELQDKIHNESVKYGDIVQANFLDSYFNNTIKTMMGFKWAATLCSEAKFYMFVDDDYYISTKNVLRFVRNPVNYPQYLNRSKFGDFELPKDVRLYAGFVFFSAPHRHLFSKWYVPLKEYRFHKWPPYVTAGAYILSHQALLDMYYGSFYTKHFRFDDVYLGLIAKKVDIEPMHCENFHFYKKEYDGGNYHFTIASHGYTPSELVQVWNVQKSMGNA